MHGAALRHHSSFCISFPMNIHKTAMSTVREVSTPVVLKCLDNHIDMPQETPFTFIQEGTAFTLTTKDGKVMPSIDVYII